MKSILCATLVTSGLAFALGGCSSTEGRHPGGSASPVGPSAIASESSPAEPSGVTAADPGQLPPRFGGVVLLPPSIFSPNVTFPPRNEPFTFRRDLEAYYQNTLRRTAIQSAVDIEGTVVWTQEYLRYRLSGCSHIDTINKVLDQIDGRGIAAECGTATFPFPPRNEPFEFRAIHLENKYRSGLGRPLQPTFVDVEGDIVWTQEYLRYRVGGCGHADASRFVFDQIAGRGISPGCAPPPPPPPPFSRSGVGNTVFDMPASITRVRIIGVYESNSSNFVVRISGRLIVNELLGRAWGATRYEGIHLITTTGVRVVEITNSRDVAWSFTHVQ